MDIARIEEKTKETINFFQTNKKGNVEDAHQAMMEKDYDVLQ